MTTEEWRETEIVQMTTQMLNICGKRPGNWPFKDAFVITCGLTITGSRGHIDPYWMDGFKTASGFVPAFDDM
jgi:hypothetical protein